MKEKNGHNYEIETCGSLIERHLVYCSSIWTSSSIRLSIQLSTDLSSKVINSKPIVSRHFYQRHNQSQISHSRQILSWLGQCSSKAMVSPILNSYHFLKFGRDVDRLCKETRNLAISSYPYLPLDHDQGSKALCQLINLLVLVSCNL